MKARLILWSLMLLTSPLVTEAHRLNEYLQATTVSIATDSIRLHLHLTAGSDIADNILMEIDPNGDGFISETEQQVYVHSVIKKMSLNINGRQTPLQLGNWSIPSEDEIKRGVGDIQLHLAAALIPFRITHHLIFENHQQPAISVYLVNCLLPADSNIHITGQSRNYDQSFYTLDFTTSTHPSTGSKGSMAKTDNTAVTETYFFHGMRHILTGYDHLLFLCAIILGASGLWNLIKIVTAFTIAHSITLTLATLGLAHLPEYIVEPIISASIVSVALQNIFWPKYSGGSGRLALAFFFGLFHGLGFAGGLLKIMHSMPPHTVFYAIIGFSIGVEAGNQLVLLPMYGILQRIKWFQTKTLRSERLITLQQLASGAIVVAGIYYLFIALATNT